MLNNDTLLVQDNFFEVIKEEYHRSHYGMMGPKILLNGGKVNPVYYHFPGLDLMMLESEVVYFRFKEKEKPGVMV